MFFVILCKIKQTKISTYARPAGCPIQLTSLVFGWFETWRREFFVITTPEETERVRVFTVGRCERLESRSATFAARKKNQRVSSRGPHWPWHSCPECLSRPCTLWTHGLLWGFKISVVKCLAMLSTHGQFTTIRRIYEQKLYNTQQYFILLEDSQGCFRFCKSTWTYQ